MDDHVIAERLKRYISTHPVDNGDTYYEYDDGCQSGRNEILEDLIDIMRNKLG